jgi:hypothetical protein
VNSAGLSQATECPEYRAYLIGEDGHFKRCRAFVCDNDADATVWAKQFVDGRDIELWNGARLVSKIGHSQITPPQLAHRLGEYLLGAICSMRSNILTQVSATGLPAHN